MQFVSSLGSAPDVMFAAVDLSGILYWFGQGIYLAMALAAGFGLYCIVILMRRIKQKSFPSRESAAVFLDEIGDSLEEGKFESVADACDQPEVWAKAVPQLITVAIVLMHPRRAVFACVGAVVAFNAYVVLNNFSLAGAI